MPAARAPTRRGAPRAQSRGTSPALPARSARSRAHEERPWDRHLPGAWLGLSPKWVPWAPRQVGEKGPDGLRGHLGRAWDGHLGPLTHVFLEAGSLCSQALLRRWLVSPLLGRAAPRSKAWCSRPQPPRKRQQTEHLRVPGHRGLQDEGAALLTKVLALALWAKRTPRVGVRETGPGDEERGSGLQHGRQARTALTTQETHQAASARRGGVRISNLGTTRNNADTPRAHDSRDRHEGLRACTGPTRNGTLLATAPPEGSGDALRPRRSASEFQAVPAQLLRLLCPTPRSACVFPRFRAPFLSYRDVSPWRLSIQTFQSVSHPLKSPPELRPRPTLQRARGRENAGGGHKSQGSDLSTPPLHRAQARAQRGGGRRVSPMGRESPLPRPLGCAGPAPACGGQCPRRKRNSEGGKHRPTARPRPGSCLLSRGPGPLRGGVRLPAIPARPRFSSGVGLSSHQQKRRQHLLALQGGPGRGPGASRTKAPVWRAAAQSPGPDLGPSPPSPERRDTEDAPKRREVPVGPTGTSWALEGARRRAHCSPTPTPQEGCWPPSSSPAATADDWRQATPPGAFGWGAG